MKLFKLWKKISKILLHRVVIVGVLTDYLDGGKPDGAGGLFSDCI